MKKALIKILLLILRFILRIARIFSLKRLSSYLSEFLKNKFDFEEEKEPFDIKKKLLGDSLSKPEKIKRDLPKREEEKEEPERSEKEYDTSITVDRNDSSKDTSGLGPVAVLAGVTAAAGIATIVRLAPKNVTDSNRDMSEVEFEPEEVEDAFRRGFEKGSNERVDVTVSASTENKGESGFLRGMLKGLKRDEKITTPLPNRFTVNLVKQYAATNHLGETMNLLSGYKYDSKTRSIGIGSSMRKINEIIIHCTADPEGREHTLEYYHNEHLKRGFSGIGYHYIIHLDGTIESARPLYLMGAHCQGHNSNSIGISYIGGTERNNVSKGKDTRTPAQKRQIWNLVLYLMKYFPSATVHGHHEFSPGKECPCFDVQKEWKALKEGIIMNGSVNAYASVTRTKQSKVQYNDNIDYQKGEDSIIENNES